MNFSSNVSELMKPFIKSFGKCDKATLSSEDNKAFHAILNTLYEDIVDSTDNVFASGCFEHKVLQNKVGKDGKSSAESKIKRPNDFTSKYFPIQIQNYIKENELYQLLFSCGNVGGREIKVYFTLFDEKDLLQVETYIEQVKMMYVWLNICDKYAEKQCTHSLDIYIYPTPFNKNLPGSTTTILGPEHVNTAFTLACAAKGQMLVFREEEWFKVFIHETFHAYGLDFATSNSNNSSDFKKKIAELYPINSDFSIYEAYTETWARIINCVFCSFNGNNKTVNGKKAFIENFLVCIELERMFALYQCVKVLSFMGLHYKDIHEKNDKKENTLSRKLYKENTHVFAYYVLSAVFLNDYEGFLLWCRKNNLTSLLKFNDNDKGFDSFFDYIKSVYNCIPLQNGIVEMGRLVGKNKSALLKKSTRMSIIQSLRFYSR